jgi:hypothetical protein
VASDHVDAEELRVFTPEDLLHVALMRDLHFDQARQAGNVFHMMSALPAHGRLGITSVGDSPEEAQERFDKAVDAIKEEARAASR